jgi:hypothetical protein
VASQKRSDFAAIAATGHRAPAAAMGARVIVKKQPARGIRAAPYRDFGSFHEQLGRGSGDGGEQPLEAAFAGDELQPPGIAALNEFVVAFGDTEEFIDRFDPVFGEWLSFHDGGKDRADGFLQAKHLEEHGIYGLRLGEQQGPQAGGPFLRHDPGGGEKPHAFFPGKMSGRRRCIRKVEGQAAGDELG